jgi:hypothetical protein
MVKLLFVQLGVIGGGFILYVLGQKCVSAYKYLRNQCKERKGWCCKKKEVSKEEGPVKEVKANYQSQRIIRGREAY